MRIHVIASLQSPAGAGTRYKLVYINEGETAGRGWGIWKAGLEASLPLFDKVWVQSLKFEGGVTDHLPPDVRIAFPSGVITSNVIGLASEPQIEQIDGAYALTGWFEPATEHMRNLLRMAAAAGKLGDFGLSINGDVTDPAHLTTRVLPDGRRIDEVLQIDELFSTDMVTHPGRGGGFSDLLASAGLFTKPRHTRGKPMNIANELKTWLTHQGIAYQDGTAPLTILASVGITTADGERPENLSESQAERLQAVYSALQAGLDPVAHLLLASEDEDEKKKDEDEKDDKKPLPPKKDEENDDADDEDKEEDGDDEKKKKLPVQASRADVLLTKLLVKDMLSEEKHLNEAVKTLVASKFAGRAADADEIAKTIKGYKEVISLVSDDGRGQHMTGRRVMASSSDKVQQACDLLFGVVPSKFKESLRALEARQGITSRDCMRRYGLEASNRALDSYQVDRIGLRELYTRLTGDADVSFDFSSPHSRTRLLEASTTMQTTLPHAVGTSINRRLIQDWMPNEVPWSKLSRIKTGGLRDFREQEIIRVAGWSEWRDVAEGAAYLELDVPTEVKETYTPGKKGELLPITREMILRDDVSLIDRLLMMFRLAGQNTFHKAFFDKFVNYNTALNNGTMGDTHPVYDAANHANLLNAAITHDNMLALKRLIRAQKAEGSDIWLQLQGQYVVIPLSLEDQNLVYILSERTPGDNLNDANVLRIKEENCIIVDDGLLRSSDYIYMSVNPQVYPTLEVGFINNQQVPEIFVQNDPTMGNAFLKDVFTWKGRHEFGIGWEDYRGVARLGTSA